MGNDSLHCIFQFRSLPPEKNLVFGTLLLFFPAQTVSLYQIPTWYYIHTVLIRVQGSRP